MGIIENVQGVKYLPKYIELLDAYEKGIKTYQNKLEGFQVTEEDKMAAVQVALDLTYLKEELDVMRPAQEQMARDLTELRSMLEALRPQQEDIADKIGKIDNTIIEPIKKNYTANKNATLEKLDEVMETGKKGNKGVKIALGFSLFFNILSTGGLIFVILYQLGIIQFM